MPFSFTDGDVAVRADIGDLFHREWQRLSGPGCWWSGAERVALARAARRARAGEPEAATEVPAAAVEAAAA
ncbi:MAG: alkylhydroperoxidase-related (seleno)protein, partial [Acidimicrobiia bacterium]